MRNPTLCERSVEKAQNTCNKSLHPERRTVEIFCKAYALRIIIKVTQRKCVWIREQKLSLNSKQEMELLQFSMPFE